MKSIQLKDEFTFDERMPILTINEDTSEAIIEGRCMPETANQMHAQMEEYLTPFLEQGKLHLSFKLEFFNTASSKVFELFLNKLQAYFTKRDADVKVHWAFLDDDEDMGEAGAEFATLVDFPFEIESY